MREIREVTYIDFLGNEYGEDDRMLAFGDENKDLSDIAKMVMFACDKYSADCSREEVNGVKSFCPFRSASTGECVFGKRFGQEFLPVDWEFENNSRFANEDLVEEIFD